MSNEKVKIIDYTLVALYEIYGEKIFRKKKELKELVELLGLMKNDYIEITKEIYDELKPFSNEIKFKFKEYRKINKDEILVLNNNKVRLEISDNIVVFDYKSYLSKIIEKYNEIVELSVKNEYGCSTGISLEYIKLGGRNIVTTFNGIGGYTPLEEVLCFINFIDGINESRVFEMFPKLIELYEIITNEKVKYNKPLIGRDIFDVESGIHVNGIVKNSISFEPYNPNKIGRNRKIVLGKHSGKKTVEFKLIELKIPYKEDFLENILDLVREESYKKKRGLYDEEITSICERVDC